MENNGTKSTWEITQYKREYNRTHYTPIKVNAKKDLAEQFKYFCKIKGVSMASVIVNAMVIYVNENVNELLSDIDEEDISSQDKELDEEW